MGRIRGFFCSFCLDDRVDSANGEPAFDRNIDVSHLATPHVTSSPAVAVADRSPTPHTPENSTEDRYSNNFESQQHSNSNSFSVSSPLQHNHYQQNQPVSNQNGHRIDELAPHIRPGSNLQREPAPSRQSSPPCRPSSASNLYAPSQDNHNEPALIEIQSHNQQRQPQREHVNEPEPPAPPPPPPPPPVIARNPLPSTSNGTTTKLSYDIISVREPLAKILAERQQLLQSQQLQRQILGDHEYIEVYGERGSSCFYEEIAGSVTSSATYDQIGAASNHNYQVLINAYSVANRQPAANSSNYEPNHAAPTAGPSRTSNGIGETNDNHGQENAYDVTSHPNDEVDAPQPPTVDFSNSLRDGQQPSTSASASADVHSQLHFGNSDSVQLTQSVPVYSVINKAKRRSTFNDNRPPKPPPKNLFVAHQQPSTSAMIYEDTSNISKHDTNAPEAWSLTPQNPSSSSYLEKHQNNDRSESPGGCNHLNNRLPQPPPRHSKNSAFNHTTDRPLPSPNNNLDKLNNNNNNRILDQNTLNRDDDIESINNGYELLRSNFEDDQIDVGYEKIRESNRYSGGSISSQFYSRQLLDNGGYESVQPIYSSPSNCYEVLNPATASEIAAAAAAKLNVIEKFLNKDQ